MALRISEHGLLLAGLDLLALWNRKDFTGLAVLKAGLLIALIIIYLLIPFLTPMLLTRCLTLPVFSLIPQ